MTRIAVRPEMCSVAGPVTLPHSFKCSPTAQALPQTGLSRSPATRHTPPDPGPVLLPEGSPPVVEQLLNREQHWQDPDSDPQRLPDFPLMARPQLSRRR